MNTKMTIEVDRSLFEQLRQYAQSKGRTISEVVEGQLKKILSAEAKEMSMPVSSKLRGIVSLPKDFDYKQELQNRPLER